MISKLLKRLGAFSVIIALMITCLSAQNAIIVSSFEKNIENNGEEIKQLSSVERFEG